MAQHRLMKTQTRALHHRLLAVLCLCLCLVSLFNLQPSALAATPHPHTPQHTARVASRPLWPGARFTEAARTRAVRRGLNFIYRTALDRNRVVTRDELLQRLWNRRASRRDRTVDVFVRRLREKIDRRASRHTFIQTRYGVGYKLEALPK